METRWIASGTFTRGIQCDFPLIPDTRRSFQGCAACLQQLYLAQPVFMKLVCSTMYVSEMLQPSDGLLVSTSANKAYKYWGEPSYCVRSEHTVKFLAYILNQLNIRLDRFFAPALRPEPCLPLLSLGLQIQKTTRVSDSWDPSSIITMKTLSSPLACFKISTSLTKSAQVIVKLEGKDPHTLPDLTSRISTPKHHSCFPLPKPPLQALLLAYMTIFGTPHSQLENTADRVQQSVLRHP